MTKKTNKNQSASNSLQEVPTAVQRNRPLIKLGNTSTAVNLEEGSASSGLAGISTIFFMGGFKKKKKKKKKKHTILFQRVDCR